MVWERVAAAVTGPRSWLLAAVAVLAGVGVMARRRARAAVTAAALAVRPDHRAGRAVPRRRSDPADRGEPGAAPAQPLTPSQDSKAALGIVPLSTTLSGLALNDAVSALRTAAATGLAADLQVHVTGGPAFGADIAGAFTHANVTLLAVTASVVALLLIATYRSPVLWLVPLLVVAFADRVAAAVGTAVASLTGLSFDGATSGITSVLVFGAGTNYALLLISRYRQELRRHAGHRDALRRAVHRAGPAIVASNATVVLALLTLLLAATPSTRSLGALAACGLVIAAVSVLVVLPPLLAVCGRRLFWPFIPVDRPATESGAWRRVAEWVAGRPRWPRSRCWRPWVVDCGGPGSGCHRPNSSASGRIRWPVITCWPSTFRPGWPTRRWSSPTPATLRPRTRRSRPPPVWSRRPSPAVRPPG